MFNSLLAQLLDYPFDRLRALLDPLPPREGRAPLVLSVGEPRHRPPSTLTAALGAHTDAWGRYPPVDGTPEFRRAAAGWLERRYRLPAGLVDPDRHLLPVAGTREALFLIAQAMVDSDRGGAEPLVLMPNPFYQVYFAAAVFARARPEFLPATAATGNMPDLAAIDAATLKRTALLYLCSPANPQGAVADLAMLTEAVDLARTWNFCLCVDECYADIYSAQPPPGVLQACAEMPGGLTNILAFHSLSKRSSVPGLRSGFVAGDERIISAFRRLRSFGGAAVPLPVLAASIALWNDERHVQENRALYRAKFDLADRLLAGRFGYTRPAGGFFLWLDVGDGETAAQRLWTEAALRVLPGAYLAKTSADGRNPGARFIRVALIDDQANTEDALRRLVNTL